MDDRPTFSRFDTIPTCQANRQAPSHTSVLHISHAKTVALSIFSRYSKMIAALASFPEVNECRLNYKLLSQPTSLLSEILT